MEYTEPELSEEALWGRNLANGEDFIGTASGRLASVCTLRFWETFTERSGFGFEGLCSTAPPEVGGGGVSFKMGFTLGTNLTFFSDDSRENMGLYV